MIGESSQIPIDEFGNSRLGSGSGQVGERVNGYDPDPEEQKTIKLAEKCFEKAKNARKPYDNKWLDNYRMFRGRQWKDNRPSYRHSEVINLIFRAIQSDVPILTDGRPLPQFIPAEPQDIELAKILNDVLEADWQSGNWLYQLTEIIYDAHFYGCGFGCVKYDPEAKDGFGAITFGSDDPFSMYPEPDALDINLKCNYFVHSEPMAVDKIKRMYPDKAKFIKPDLLDLTKQDRTNWNERTKYQSPTDNRSIVEGQSYDLKNKDQALVITLYIHDQEYIEKEDKTIDPDTGAEDFQYIQQLKYPKGRKIVTVGGVLCEDSELEYDDRKFPYIRLVNYILPREFWGISEVEQLESPQKTFNKLVSFALDVLTLMGNPIWVVSTDSGIDTDNLVNRPGLIVEKNPNSEVRREEGVQLQPYVLQMIDRMKQYFDDISGSNDVSRGIRPEGITSGDAIQALQEAGQTRLRQKTRNIDAFLQQFGQMYVSRVFQYYDVPRVFRITGDDGSQKYFKFHVEHRPEHDAISGMPTGETEKVAKIRGYDMQNQAYDMEEREYIIRAEFDVKVQAGSSLPFEKSRIEQQTYALFDRGIIDPEEVLKNLKYPNAEAVLGRMQQKADAAAAAQAQSAPPSGGSAPVPQ